MNIRPEVIVEYLIPHMRITQFITLCTISREYYTLGASTSIWQRLLKRDFNEQHKHPRIQYIKNHKICTAIGTFNITYGRTDSAAIIIRLMNSIGEQYIMKYIPYMSELALINASMHTTIFRRILTYLHTCTPVHDHKQDAIRYLTTLQTIDKSTLYAKMMYVIESKCSTYTIIAIVIETLLYYVSKYISTKVATNVRNLAIVCIAAIK